ncbi:MAG: hypothetical protein AB8B94_07890 [Hyphomicrobiales bacterium]
MITRRSLISSAILAATGAMSGCGLSPAQRKSFTANCEATGGDIYKADGSPKRLYIDSHCHLMTSRDSDQAAFIARKVAPRRFARGINERRFNRFLDNIVQLVDRDYRTARKEANDLLKTTRRDGSNGKTEWGNSAARIEHLCKLGRPSGLDLVVAKEGTGPDTNQRLGNGRTTGFVTSRTRNAAIMMAQFPKVDLFVPSVVDFYEGDPEGYSDPVRQMQYYTALAIVSEGRFLPMVSFNPERYYEEKRDRHAFDNLDLVRKAIEFGGAIGVKVHPSSGFDPYRNVDYAQLGEGRQRDKCHNRSNDEQKNRNAERYEMMDKGMSSLFELCSELDVPILTHSGTTIASVSHCMYGASDPNNWTNSTLHWAKALVEARPKAPKARVSLAHLAGGFGDLFGPSEKTPEGRSKKDKWFVPNPYEYDSSENLIPSDWLKTAIDHISSSSSSDMYIDTSVMDELAYSQAFRENRISKEQGQDAVWKIAPGIRQTSRGAIAKAREDEKRVMKRKYSDKSNFADKFSNFVDKTSVLHDRLVYGSDLHMNAVATVSESDAYLDLIEGAIPDKPGLRSKVMGGNAATLFGLRHGNTNRGRIERFLKDTGTDPKSVRWIQKLDALKTG